MDHAFWFHHALVAKVSIFRSPADSSFDEVLSGSTLRAVLRRATVPVLVVPVVGGGHAWIDDVQEDAHTLATGAESVRQAA